MLVAAFLVAILVAAVFPWNRIIHLVNLDGKVIQSNQDFDYLAFPMTLPFMDGKGDARWS